MTRKRGFADGTRQYDDHHPTVSAIAPLICFASIFTVLVLLRIIVSFGAVAARCVETDQFWYTAAQGNWPLFASFAFILFLLLVWNVFIGFDDWTRSAGTKVVVIINALAIITTLYTLIPLHENAYIQYHARNGYYEEINFRTFLNRGRGTEDQCSTMRRFAGRWRVVDREIGHYGFDVPALWIELKPWGDVLGADATRRTPYAGWWRPPYQSGYSDDKRWSGGDIYVDRFRAPWDFELRGDYLILTTPDYFNEWEKSKITLQRDDSK